MQNLIPAVNAPTMTSLELVDFINANRKRQAELSGDSFSELQHKHFLAKVLVVLGAETSAKFSADLPDVYGRARAGYRFPKRESCLMAMSYSYDLQAAVFDHMSALENQLAAPAIPQTLPEALRLAADLAEQNSHLQLVVAEQAPKIEALNRIAVADGSLCITDAAKSLQIRRKDLITVLMERKWIYRRLGSTHYVAYQDKIQSGVMEHKYSTVERPDGTEKTTEQARITPKGLVRLATIIREAA